MTVVKICGLRSVKEARVALQSGANYLGFIFWKSGKRFIRPPEAAHIISSLRRESLDWSAVGVFVDPSPLEVLEVAELCGLDYVQLSGHESREVVSAMPRPVVKAIHVRAGEEVSAVETVSSNALGAERFLLDTHTDDLPGGTGRAFNWEALKEVGARCLVAGGLRPDNVAAALTA